MAENAVDSVGSPLWWMARLARKQQKRLPRLKMLKQWQDGDPPLPEGAPEWMPAYQSFHKTTRTNYYRLVTESARERMTVKSFRTGATGDDNGDLAAEKMWVGNHMQVESATLLSNMIGLSEGYTMIVPPGPTNKTGMAEITVEDPLQVVTAADPVNRWNIRAAMKQYRDEDYNSDITWIYITNEDGTATGYKAVRKSNSTGSPFTVPNRGSQQTWQWEDPVELPAQPFVRFPNFDEVADAEPHLDLLGRLNHQTLQRMLIAELQAFKQRAIKGLPEYYPNDFPVPEMRGKRIDYAGIFTPGPGSLWQVPEGVDFWESQPIDIRPLLDAEDRDIRKLAALAHMPVAYFNPDAANGSAEGASFQREGLVYRVEDRQQIAQVGLMQTMARAFLMSGDRPRADEAQVEVIWAPIERLSLAERYSAASQGKAAGLSNTTIRREILGWDPRQMRRAASDDDAALFDEALRAPMEPARSEQPVPTA